MQTFITHSPVNHSVTACVAVCELTSQALDPKRLGKQRVEAKQIFEALTTGKGWIHHPATKMWSGHEQALAVYGKRMCEEWQRRGYEDSLWAYFADAYWRAGKGQAMDENGNEFPWWFGDPNMVATHRSKLRLKLPQHYGPDWGRTWEQDGVWETLALPYIWPSAPGDFVPQGFYISKAEIKRESEWEVPPNWNVDFSTRRVIFA